MDAETALYDRLVNWQALALLVGVNVYPVAAPSQAVPPFVVYTRTSSDPARSFDGVTHTDCTFQLDSYAVDFADAQAIAAAVRGALDQFYQAAPLPIFQSHYAGQQGSRADAGNIFRIIQEFAVTHR